ncbi:MAG: toxin-antitoxin system HicB family antitoxin [Anaerolinea sp.]|nr:toxin-antitoxin system HicB family antitoxin [Anaerolinea sp.]HRI56838.1 toxin-antitoxin system HicB family antitoxin [Anaerolineae bacterium]
MSALNLRLPESLHHQVRELAQRDKVSINQFVTLAVAEKVAALRTLDYIEGRGRQGSRAQFDHVLDRVVEANLEPVPEDRLPAGVAVEAS